jgi:hypothetical protein
MSAPNEKFALAIFELVSERLGKTLTRNGHPEMICIDAVAGHASSGERALIDLALASWRNSSGSLTGALAWVDRELRSAVLDALGDAYEEQRVDSREEVLR